jgi:hypothetical protein
MGARKGSRAVSLRPRLRPPQGSYHTMTFWDALADRTWMSREYTKTCAYVLLYGGRIDPWLDHILSSAIDEFAATREFG